MPASEFELTTEIFINAEPALVYEFFTDASLLERWHGVDVQADPHPGGRFIMNVTGEDTTRGDFVVTEPGHRLVFTWGFKQAGATRVEVRFVAEGEGTRVILHQTGFDTAQDCDGHEAGWNHYLDRLPAAVRGDDPGPDSYRTAAGDRIALGKRRN